MLIHKWWVYLLPLVGVLFLLVRLKRWFRAARVIISLPGPPVLPLIGNFLHPGKDTDFIEFLRIAYSKYGSLVGSWLFFYPVVLVLEPKHLQVILGSPKLIDKEVMYNVMEGIVGSGVVSTSGNLWKTHRAYIQPYFNSNTFEDHIPSFLKCARLLVEDLKGTKDVRITSVIHKCMLNVLHEFVLGIPVDDNATKARSPFIRLQNSAMERLSDFWYLLDFVYIRTKSYRNSEQQKQAWKNYVVEALQHIQNNKRDELDAKESLLEHLVEISKVDDTFQIEDIINEACTFMLTGHDSTVLTISYTLYYLAKYQDIQDSVIHEVNRVFQETNVINMATLKRLKYLEQCIKESMRLSPPGPLIARQLCEDVKLDNYVIPAGCNVFISPYATHRLPHYYPNPENFDPERFSKANQEKRDSFVYIPFSAGPRNCIAYKLAMVEMKIVISTLLRSYRFYLEAGHEEFVPLFRIVLKSKRSIWLKMEPRNVES